MTDANEDLVASAARLQALARQLTVEGRPGDAVVLLEHLNALNPSDATALRDLAHALAARGRTLEACDALVRARDLLDDPVEILADIQRLSAPAAASFNAHLAAGEVEAAAGYAAALVRLAPQNPALLAAALECHRNLGRWNEVAAYARALTAIEPDSVPAHSALAEICKVTGDLDGEIGHRMALVLSPANPLHPLLRLRDTHDVTSLILCHPLTPERDAQAETLLAAAQRIVVGAEPGSDWVGWETHYRLLLAATDLDAVRGPTPEPAPDAELEFRSASTGKAMGWKDLRAAAQRLGARTTFFAAADEAYVDLYARWYALSILKHTDVSCLVVIHVIGGAGRLSQIARRVGIIDERLIFTADAFDAAAITTACYDSPPKDRIDKPVAHFQSARFQRLGALVRELSLPVFVSDIDLILQRGVADLLDRCAADDLVLNENEVSFSAGSRLTANLLLVNPTPNARRFLDFLRGFLDAALAGTEVTRWIDQLALLLARHHLMRHGDNPRIGYFDTASDINNVMYTTYQEHPFRFLSLYHGFDTSSLEGDVRVAG